jgi:hypothetical protein
MRGEADRACGPLRRRRSLEILAQTPDCTTRRKLEWMAEMVGRIIRRVGLKMLESICWISSRAEEVVMNKNFFVSDFVSSPFGTKRQGNFHCLLAHFPSLSMKLQVVIIIACAPSVRSHWMAHLVRLIT